MATQFKKGDAVRQVMPKPVEGVVDRFTFDEATGDVGVVVQYKDGDGAVHERAFRQGEVEAVAKEDEAAAKAP